MNVYDAETRSEILNDQNNAALRSMFELAHASTATATELFFGPEPPADEQAKSR